MFLAIIGGDLQGVIFCLSMIPCLITFFIITLFVQLYEKVGILLTCRKTYMTASFHEEGRLGPIKPV